MMFGARRAVRSLSRLVISQAIDHTEAQLGGFVAPIVDQLLLLRSWGSKGLLDLETPEHLQLLLTPLLENNPKISAVILADGRGFEYMLLRKGEQWTSRRITNHASTQRVHVREWTQQETKVRESWPGIDYDPRHRPWYRGAQEKHGESDLMSTPAQPLDLIHWTEPYVFFTVKQLGITASVRFLTPDGREHVIGLDVLLSDVQTFASHVKVLDHGNVAILTDDYRIVACPAALLAKTGLGHDAILLKMPQEIDWPLVTEFQEALTRQQSSEPAYTGPVRFICGSQPWWGVGKIFALAADRSFLTFVMVPESDLLDKLEQHRTWIFIISLAVLIIGVIRVVVLAGRYSDPIETLVTETDRISRGDLEPGAAVESNVTEVRQLAVAHDRMRIGLQSLMKMEGDMQLAQQIQQQTFPKHLPRLNGFDIDAWNQPADETGGDTYDVIGYNTRGDSKPMIVSAGHADHAILLLADATGHGIGPALSVTQLRAMLRMGIRISPEMLQIVSHMNNQLCADLPQGRFITAWLAELNAAHHTLTYFSAGQGPLIRYHADTDEFDILKADACPFGITEDIDTTASHHFVMNPGDIFAVISDGILECADPDKTQFGTERSCAVIRSHRRSPAQNIVAALIESAHQFTRGAPPTDDRTIIIIKRV